MAFEDKTLVCQECGREFIFTAGEQEFYQERGLQNEPKRCPECRAMRRQSRYSNYGGSGGGSGSFAPRREMFQAVCAACGCECEVPFQPREGRPVYCRECFMKIRSGELRQQD